MATTTAKKTTARQAAVKTTAARKTAPAKKAATPVKKTAVPAPKTAPAPAAEKTAKAKKPKLVRDSFTIPKDEYAALQQLKTRAQKLGHAVKKSELLRAGIKLLTAQADTAFKTALQAVPVIKTGRPKSAK